MKTLDEYREEVKTYGYVGNCKNLLELGPKLMVTAGLENQLDIANHIIASAEFVRKACRKALNQESVDLKYFRDILNASFEYGDEASEHYDQLVQIYHTYGRKDAMENLQQILED